MPASSKPNPRLIVVSEQGHLFFELSQSECRLGRAPDNDIVLKDNLISRRHAVIEFSDARYHLRDLHSHNGTYLNGKRVFQEPLKSWDTARVGGSLVFFIDPGQLTEGSESYEHLRTRTDTKADERAPSEFNEDATAGGSALERIYAALSEVVEDVTAREIVEGLLREERQSVLDRILGRIRKESVPSGIPFFDNYQIVSRRVGAFEGGGDFFDLVPQGNSLVVALGNVRSWGLTASVNAAMARATVRAVMEIAKAAPDVLVVHCERALERVLHAESVFHVLLAKLSPRGELQATCRGSVSALLFRPSSRMVELLRNAEDASAGVAMSFSALLASGDGLLLVSEGATKSKSSHGEPFSAEHIRKAVLEAIDEEPSQLLESLTAAYSRHTLHAQDRDATFVIIGRSASKRS